MTEFKKAEDLFDRLLQAHETLVINHLPKANSSSRDELPPSKEDLQQYNNFENLINQCGDYILKFKKRLLDASKNPDVAVYGPKMKTKVEGLIERYEQVYEQYQDIIQPLFEHAVLEEKDRLRREEERRQKDKKDAIEKDVEQKAQWAAHFDKTRKEMERAQQEREAADKERADAQDAELIAKRREEEIRILSMDEDTKICTSIREMLEDNTSMTIAELRMHLGKLKEYISAIVSRPEDSQLRTIRLANRSFNDNIGSLPGAILFLRGVGFQPTIDNNNTSDIIRFIKLSEPDAVKDWKYWGEWQKRLERYVDFLSSFEKEMPTSFDSQRLFIDQANINTNEIIKLWHTTGITTGITTHITTQC